MRAPAVEYQINLHPNCMIKLASLFTFVIVLTIGCQAQGENQNNAASILQKRFPNPLVNKKYQTERLIGLNKDKFDHLLIDIKEQGKWAGNTIKFTDSIHFVSAYEAWCGNDCFTTVFGRYYFVDSLKVRFYTDSISRSGDCKAPTVYTKSRPALNLYLVKTAEGTQLNQRPESN